MLALGGERKLDLHASGLTAIRWWASRVLKPYLGFLATQPQPFTNTDIPFDALSDVQEGVIALKRTDPGVPQFTVLDVAPLFKDGRGLMRIELVGMDGDKLFEIAKKCRYGPIRPSSMSRTKRWSAVANASPPGISARPWPKASATSTKSCFRNRRKAGHRDRAYL